MTHIVTDESKSLVIEMVANGASFGDMEEKLKISNKTFSKYYKNEIKGYDGAQRGLPKWVVSDRDKDMCDRYKKGETLQEIGVSYSITRERVRQIISRCGVTRDEGGEQLRAFLNNSEKRSKKRAEQELRKIKSWGCTLDEYNYFRGFNTDYCKTPINYFKNQENSAKNRGIEWSLTLPQWWGIWERSGKYELRGRGKGKYVMARIEDLGGYEIGNIEIIEFSQNAKDYYSIYKSEWYEKMRKSHGWSEDIVMREKSNLTIRTTVLQSADGEKASKFLSKKYNISVSELIDSLLLQAMSNDS